MRWMLLAIREDGQQLLLGRQEHGKTRGNRQQRLMTSSHLTTSLFDQICVTCSLLSGVRCWLVHAVGVLLRPTPPQIKSPCRPLTQLNNSNSMEHSRKIIHIMPRKRGRSWNMARCLVPALLFLFLLPVLWSFFPTGSRAPQDHDPARPANFGVGFDLAPTYG